MKIFTNDCDQITKYDMKVRLKHIRGEIKGATVCLDESVFENPQSTVLLAWETQNLN